MQSLSTNKCNGDTETQGTLSIRDGAFASVLFTDAVWWVLGYCTSRRWFVFAGAAVETCRHCCES